MKTISLDFTSLEMFEKAAAILDAKNADSFLLNISMNVENELKGVEIEHDLQINNVDFSAKIY